MRSWIWLVLLVGPVTAQTPPECSKQQLVGYQRSAQEVASHRRFVLPDISYPAAPGQFWGFILRARISESGKVVCYQLEPTFDFHPQHFSALNERRRAFLSGLGSWSYTPFMHDGRPVPALVSEEINEHELSAHTELPSVPLEQVRIVLERTVCYGSCPAYRIELFGDGRATYTGIEYVDVVGTHAYRVPPEAMAHLVDSLRAKDIWSLQPVYRARVTDLPTYTLVLRLGIEQHQIEDNGGQWVGMPATVSAFEEEIDEVARTAPWINLSGEAVAHLEAEGFDFHSPEAAALLYRAVANEDAHDTQAMLRLVTLGAPIEGGIPGGDSRYAMGHQESLLEQALLNQRGELLDALIAGGALQTDGRPDQAKIDTAFRAAIVGGRLALVRRIWEVQGDRPHPSLTFKDVATDAHDKPVQKRSPVTLELSHSEEDETPWEGRAIAEWLAAKGCDLNAVGADGTTLRDIALRAGDRDFVRFLRARGAGAATARRSPRGRGLP